MVGLGWIMGYEKGRSRRSKRGLIITGRVGHTAELGFSRRLCGVPKDFYKKGNIICVLLKRSCGCNVQDELEKSRPKLSATNIDTENY